MKAVSSRPFIGLGKVCTTAGGTTDHAYFHKDWVLYSRQDGTLVVRPFAVYREMVQGRQSPALRGCPRSEDVLLVDVFSPTVAMVKVRLRLSDSIMEDHLNLMKHEGWWRVCAKYFHRAGSA